MTQGSKIVILSWLDPSGTTMHFIFHFKDICFFPILKQRDLDKAKVSLEESAVKPVGEKAALPKLTQWA
uniref:Uncharacterized protein n=1 Tax=Anguilla anguilla TaxID=7936 RepID=A0A0E9TVX2_ANGAN